jgi:enoyl-CoA hydratase/carnithine racemase
MLLVGAAFVNTQGNRTTGNFMASPTKEIKKALPQPNSDFYQLVETLETATETAQQLEEKPVAALQASKRLVKKPWRDALLEAAKAENSEFSVRVRSADSKEAITAFFEKRPPDFTWSRKAAVA